MRTDVTCEERYVGTEADIASIADALQEKRRTPLTPENALAHLRRVKGDPDLPVIRPCLLSAFVERRDIDGFDYAFFETAVEIAAAFVRTRLPGFASLRWQSYLVADAVESSGLGGFHGRCGVGFQYESNFGFSELLNRAWVPDSRIRALELARNYVHDSIHAATFRSFGWFDGAPFRYQYGINFRLPNGLSYSGTQQNPDLRFVINLNTLMDGVVASITAEAMRCIDAEVSVVDGISRSVVEDIRGESARAENVAMRAFADAVIVPTTDFLSYWGGETCRDAIGRAMISGVLSPLRNYIEARCAEKADDRALSGFIAARRRDCAFLGRDLWEDLFLSKDFHRGLIIDDALHPLARDSGIVWQ
jgi:hypothetical protein